MLDVYIDPTNYFIFWGSSFIIGFIVAFLIVLLISKISKGLSLIKIKLFWLIILSCGVLGGILCTFLASGYVSQRNKSEKERLVLLENKYPQRMMAIYEIKEANKQGNQIKISFTIPKAGAYLVSLYGHMPKKLQSGFYEVFSNNDIPILSNIEVINYYNKGRQLYIANLQTLHTESDQPIDLIFVVQPRESQVELFARTNKLVDQSQDELRMYNGIIYHSPRISNACGTSSLVKLACVTENRFLLLANN